jgi:hypothetical protein
VFERLRKFNIKLNLKKSELLALHIIWCGWRISKMDYALNVAPLQELLKRCQGQANSAKASELSRIS